LNPIGQSLEDMQFAELAEQTRKEIATLFHIPAAYLNTSTGDSLTYANEASNDRQFHRLAVLPIAETIAKALSADPSLLPWNVMYAEFTYEAILRVDPKTQADYFQVLQTVLNLDPEYIATRLNIPKDALKPEPAKPEPVVPPADPAVPLRALNP
jgi:phage portal protein BeeE